ncbi:hypothetical protein STEG23_017749, partial [Scotinomys teguina]
TEPRAVNEGNEAGNLDSKIHSPSISSSEKSSLPRDNSQKGQNSIHEELRKEVRQLKRELLAAKQKKETAAKAEKGSE